jgi:hypothetical protein
MSKKPFDTKIKNGKPNPKYVDLLNEDPVIASQLYGCYSFISPENIIKKKDQYIFEQFVKQWDFTKSVSIYSDFLKFVSFKYKLKMENLLSDFQEFIKEEENALKAVDAETDFKTFLERNEDKLNEQFQREHEFQTSVRGFINRGNFSTPEEAEKYAKQIRERDPNHDIFVGRNFVWTPMDPDAYKTGRIEFMEEELNQLHHEKLKNETKAKEEFEKRVFETKKNAIEKNIELAKKTGNVLTQTMDENGQLIGVREKINFEEREVATEGGDEMRKKFEK